MPKDNSTDPPKAPEPAPAPSTPPATPPAEPPAETIWDEVIADLKTTHPNLDLSFLSKKEQVKAYLALKKATPPPATPPAAPPAAPPTTTPLPAQNPATPPAPVDEPKIPSFAERNAVGGKWWEEHIGNKSGVRLYRGKE